MENAVQQTRDYDKFQFMEANRDYSQKHVSLLIETISEVGDFTKSQPILVNDKYQIIDGQHRFLACKELGLPIYYTMIHGLGVREARVMNATQKKWTINDFAKSYAESGDPNYKTYLELREDYGVTNSVLLNYITNRNIGGKNIYKIFRDGEFVIEDLAGAKERLDKLVGLGVYTDLVKDRPFSLAYLKIMQLPNYDHDRMLKKASHHANAVLTHRSGAIEENMRMLEELYNFRAQENNRVRLY